ncbi:MAG: tetratricopeptide repeat protein [Prochloraceae cyanobacterium]|nr:tetratricopeptide repeat protein [Prochloraceae cyanobacterium]
MSIAFKGQLPSSKLHNHLFAEVGKKVYSSIILVGLTAMFLMPAAPSVAQQHSRYTGSLFRTQLELVTAENLLQRGIYKSSSGNLRGAIADFNQALSIDPNLAEAYYHRGVAQRRLENSPRFKNAYTEGLQVRGLARLQLGYLRGAVADFTEVLNFNPNSADAYINRGLARLELGDSQRAAADFTKALKINPNSAYAYRHRAFARRQLGDNEGAISDWQKAAISRQLLTN